MVDVGVRGRWEAERDGVGLGDVGGFIFFQSAGQGLCHQAGESLNKHPQINFA